MVERGDRATAPNPDEAGAEAGSLPGSWCLGKENAGASKDFFFYLKLCQEKLHLLAKIHLAKQLERQGISPAQVAAMVRAHSAALRRQ
jgi:hypothetical protein